MFNPMTNEPFQAEANPTAQVMPATRASASTMSPQMIRAIMNSPKGKLPAGLARAQAKKGKKVAKKTAKK